MSGDFSRKTFIPHKHYSGVLMQQGRVQLDADWNEQHAIQQHRTEIEALDVIGPCGVPQASDGFKIGQTPDGTDLTISPGRIYVDGLLCELEATPVSMIGFVQNNPTQAILQTSIVDGRPLQVGQWVEIWADDDPTKILFQIVDVDPEQSILTFQNDITAYQSSTAPKLRRVTTYMTQPDYPNPTPLSPLSSPPTSPPSEGTYLVFLDVWQRHITAHDDPHIREVALGGPDSTTRVKNVWQVHLVPVTTETMSPPTSPPSSEVTCHTPFAEWDQRTAPSTGTLNARTIIVEEPENACLMPPSSGYRRLENQLYRVEVHTGGTRDQATFKWSRDNASVETTIELIDGDKVTVTDIGKDDVLGFADGQWVEIVDDESELKGTPHPLLQIEKVNPVTREITMQQSVPALEGGTHLKLRRWDQTGPAATTDGVKIVPGWIDLEDGVQVLLSEGFYHPGDYWLVPARTVTGEIEWPPFEIPNQHPIPQPPLGIRHHYCRLALLEVQDGALNLMDCRMPFPPLTEVTSFCYIGGGGQEAMPGEFLPCPLQVAVMNGQSPVVGARVSFAITAGSGGTLHAGADSGTLLTVETDGAGVAQCEWELSGLEAGEGGHCLQVEARRVDAAGELADPPIRFNASFSVASQVAYDPRECANLEGVTTVQEAIDRLCKMERGSGCEITVGAGGQFARLEEAVEALRRDPQQTNWCICLLPGTHVLPDGLQLAGASADIRPHVKISACGPGTRIVLGNKPLVGRFLTSCNLTAIGIQSAGLSIAMLFESCQAVALRDLTMDAVGGQGGDIIRFQNCQSAELHDVAITARETRAITRFEDCSEVLVSKSHLVGEQEVGELTVIGKGSQRIHLDSNVLTASVVGEAGPGPALIIHNGEANTTLDTNIISGLVSLYDEPGSSELTVDHLAQLRASLRENRIRLTPANGVFQGRGNRLTRLVVGETLIRQILDLVNANGGELTGLYKSFLLTDNVIEAYENSFAAGRLSIASTFFNRAAWQQNFYAPAGVVIGEAATYLGNHTPDNRTRLVNVAPSRQDAANLIPISDA